MMNGNFSKINSLLSQTYLLKHLNDLQNSISKQTQIATTGKKINSASDGPATYVTIRKLDKKISDNSAKQNVLENSIDYLQKNDSYLSQVVDILAEMTDLANQATGVDVTTAEKVAIQEDLNQLRSSIDDILSSGVASKLYTGFSVGNLSNASLIGTTTDTAQPTLSGLTLNGTNINVTGTATEITDSITNLGNAYNLILKDEARTGSFIKRLEVQQDTLEIEETNYTASKSTLEDADLAETQLEIVRLSLLHNITLALMAQANTYSANIVKLIG